MFHARWYDSETGRFVSRDQLADRGNSQHYAYAANSPVKYIDTDGNKKRDFSREGMIYVIIGNDGKGDSHWFWQTCCYLDPIAIKGQAMRLAFELSKCYPQANVLILDGPNREMVKVLVQHESTIGIAYVGHGGRSGSMYIAKDSWVDYRDLQQWGVDLEFLILLACNTGKYEERIDEKGRRIPADFVYAPDHEVNVYYLPLYRKNAIEGLCGNMRSGKQPNKADEGCCK